MRVVGRDEETAPTFRSDYSYEDWVADLRGLIWNAFIKGRMTLEMVAEKSNLHLTTVEKFAFGETKRPASRTTFELARAIGFRMPLIPSDADRQPAEQDYSTFRAHTKTR